MNATHPETLRAFALKLRLLLALRIAVRMATVWLFLWAIAVLAIRFSIPGHSGWLGLGVLGFVPIALLAIWGERRRLGPDEIRATYDRLNSCGGILMSQEVADMGAWLPQLPQPSLPGLRWRGTRSLSLLTLAAAFASVALLLPEPMTRLARTPSLEIRPIIEQLQAEVSTLAQEKILESTKAEEMQKQLAQLQKDSSGHDPSKTWEALDHLKQSNADAARQAADEALRKTASLTDAELMAKAVLAAAESGMSEVTATQAAQELASMLNAAKLETGILDARIPPELLSGLSGLNREGMQELAKALGLNKGTLGRAVTNLANLRMIDPALLAKCQKAGQCPNPGALADFLSKCTNGFSSAAALEILRLCRGGPGGGGPAAPMTWDNDTSEEDLKFQPHGLPPGGRMSDAQLVGVSKTAPLPAPADLQAGRGALDGASGSGGSAQTQVILPEHRQAVRSFFQRNP